MARKKKTAQTTPEPAPTQVTPTEAAPPAPAKVMAQTAWRSWGAPAWVVESNAPLVIPARTQFEVLELGRDEAIALHPITGERVLVRRGMIVVV